MSSVWCVGVCMRDSRMEVRGQICTVSFDILLLVGAGVKLGHQDCAISIFSHQVTSSILK